MPPLKPPAVRPGDTVGIVATSSPLDADDVQRVVAYLEARGHPVRIADGVTDRDGYLSGPAERRAAGVMQMFTDPDVTLVLPINGGTGADHVVDLLDFDVIRAHPTLLTGFSNLTVLTNAVWAASGLATLHAVNGRDFSRTAVDPVTEAGFWAMAGGGYAGNEVSSPEWRVHRAPHDTVTGKVTGTVTGTVVGGNLIAMRALVGTRWMPSTSGAVLLLEAMTATFEQIDNALTHLRLAGVFDGINALVIGEPADWPREDAPDADVDELILRCVGGDFPVVTNVGYGHRPDRIPFPIGCRVSFDLNGAAPVLRYLEDVVRARP